MAEYGKNPLCVAFQLSPSAHLQSYFNLHQYLMLFRTELVVQVEELKAWL